MAKLTMYLNETELETLLNHLPGDKVIEMGATLMKWNTKWKRQDEIKDYILSYLPKQKISLYNLFDRLKRKGYPLSRKTFTRDIMELVSNGSINREVVNGGLFGSTSYISINKQSE